MPYPAALDILAKATNTRTRNLGLRVYMQLNTNFEKHCCRGHQEQWLIAQWSHMDDANITLLLYCSIITRCGTNLLLNAWIFSASHSI